VLFFCGAKISIINNSRRILLGYEVKKYEGNATIDFILKCLYKNILPLLSSSTEKK
jgi:hypothetical protein